MQRCSDCNAVIADGVQQPYDPRRTRCDACARDDAPRRPVRAEAADDDDADAAPRRRARH